VNGNIGGISIHGVGFTVVGCRLGCVQSFVAVREIFETYDVINQRQLSRKHTWAWGGLGGGGFHPSSCQKKGEEGGEGGGIFRNTGVFRNFPEKVELFMFLCINFRKIFSEKTVLSGKTGFPDTSFDFGQNFALATICLQFASKNNKIEFFLPFYFFLIFYFLLPTPVKSEC